MRKSKNYNYSKLPPLNKEQINELEKLNKQKDSDIDYSDAPKLSDNEIKNAHFYYANSLKMPKESIHILLDKDNIEWLKSLGKGYQTRLNKVIRWARLNNCPLDEM